jgi:putative sterol carrier protein
MLDALESALTPHFKPGFLQRDHTIFQFLFSESEPSFHLSVTSDSFKFHQGKHKSPTLTVTIDNHQHCIDLLSGRLDGMEAFMSGSYRADGNIVLSQLLLYLFKEQDSTNIYQVSD